MNIIRTRRANSQETDGVDGNTVRDLQKTADERTASAVLTLDTVQRKRVPWLAPGWLALGMLHGLNAPGGLGKSSLTDDMAACISRGWELFSPPEQRMQKVRKPRDVVIIQVEDPTQYVLAPRLHAYGADLKRIHVLRDLPRKYGKGEQIIRLPDDTDAVLAVVDRYEATLLLIDPTLSFLGSTNIKDPVAVRNALMPLVDGLQARSCAGEMVSHVPKGGSNLRADQRTLGSVAFGDLSRITMNLDPHPWELGKYVLSVAKSNLGPKPESIVFSLQPATLRKAGLPLHKGETGEELSDVATVVWDGATVPFTAQALHALYVSEDRRNIIMVLGKEHPVPLTLQQIAARLGCAGDALKTESVRQILRKMATDGQIIRHGRNHSRRDLQAE